MFHGSRRGNPFVAALLGRDRDPRPPLQVANGTRADTMPGPQVASDAPAEAVKVAWLPLMTGQPVPMLGEAVPDVDPGYDE